MVYDSEGSQCTKIKRESGITFSFCMSCRFRMKSIISILICFPADVNKQTQSIREVKFTDETETESYASIRIVNFLPRMLGISESKSMSYTNSKICFRAEE